MPPGKTDIWLEVTLIFFPWRRLLSTSRVSRCASELELRNSRISKRNSGPGASSGQPGPALPPSPFFFGPGSMQSLSQLSSSCRLGAQARAHLGRWEGPGRAAAAAHLPWPSPTWRPRVATLSVLLCRRWRKPSEAGSPRAASPSPCLRLRPPAALLLPRAARWTAPATPGLAACLFRDLPETLPPSGRPEFHRAAAIRPTDRCEVFPRLVGRSHGMRGRCGSKVISDLDGSAQVNSVSHQSVPQASGQESWSPIQDNTGRHLLLTSARGETHKSLMKT